MSELNRRNILTALATVAGAQALPGSALAQETTNPGIPTAAGGTLGPAHAIAFDSVPASATANGGDRRVMLHGALATGERVEVHQSTQMPGTPAPALHVIHHSELILVREGTLKFDHEVDGRIVSETVGPGGIFYVAYGTRHAASNAGTTPARYFVVEIGGDVS